ncbi:recombinase family protein [Rugamonas apoptosis]|uniref:Recombinase family protein n=1 Tax=Rugamonas apoptosis TaxID=2758570 RepID=A0A7W2FF65_9BURK|nr:recombinase family protein [Rugamonas apoptosis]MBA5690565.1 recombinase family protein [Rugamonas apoptosis]
MNVAFGSGGADGLLRAAAYVRMSSTAQILSPQMQEAYLRRYAATHAMVVVRVYADLGCSGLVLAGRSGLQQLLADVAAGNTDFAVLLVYDVSRWGRYQDGDEAGFYEFLCRKAGIRLLYCAEAFVNDGAPLSQLLKSIKRSMAAEYSRELSAKVWAGQRRLALLGYKQGGAATYGLRRIVVSADGREQRTLATGERKPRPSDRVLLAPGAPQELAVVRRIFHLYNHVGWTLRAIARQLNAEGVACGGAAWTDYRVSSVLRKEHYWGNLLYNRSSARMKTARVHNPPESWLRKEGALAAIVPPAQGLLAELVRRMRNGEAPEAVLAAIRRVYARYGKVTLALLAAVPGMPGWRRMARMFGSLAGAYAHAGVPPPRQTQHVVAPVALAAMVARLREQVCIRVAAAGGQSEPVVGIPNQLRLNGDYVLRLSVLTCRQRADGQCRWRLAVQRGRAVDFILAGLLDRDNRVIERYALVATAQERRQMIYIGSGLSAKSRPLLHSSLDAVFGLAGPVVGPGP